MRNSPCYEKPLSRELSLQEAETIIESYKRSNCGVEEASHSDISTTHFLHLRDHCARRLGKLLRAKETRHLL